MTYTFNQFVAELEKKGMDKHNAYFFTLLYERLIETEKVVMEGANVINLLAEQLQRFTTLREQDIEQIKHIRERMNELGKHDGIDIQSVANEPEDR